MDRLQQIFAAAEKVPLSKNQASIFVGGRSRLERLAAEKKIRYVKTSDKPNGRWDCNGADVLRYAKNQEPCIYICLLWRKRT